MTREEARAFLEQTAPPAPACFAGRGVWMRWLIAASELFRPGEAGSPIRIVRGKPTFNVGVSFCSDCEASYRSEMLKAGRCNPDAVRAFKRSKESA